jgi:hypothetical protein
MPRFSAPPRRRRGRDKDLQDIRKNYFRKSAYAYGHPLILELKAVFS